MPAATSADKVRQARERLDAHVRDIVRWHFSPDTGTPLWIERAKSFSFNPLKDVQGFDDLKLFGLFEDTVLPNTGPDAVPAAVTVGPRISARCRWATG